MHTDWPKMPTYERKKHKKHKNDTRAGVATTLPFFFLFPKDEKSKQLGSNTSYSGKLFSTLSWEKEEEWETSVVG